MPKRNIGWRWHLASFPEITAWQLEVNKSWSCEKLFPSLLPSLLLSSLQRQTPQHVFHILASQFIELLSGSWLSHRLAPTPLSVPPKSGGGELGRGWSAPVAGWGAETWEMSEPGGWGGLDAAAPASTPARRQQSPRETLPKFVLKPLFAITPQPVLWQEKLWQQKWDALRPRYHWQVRMALYPKQPLCFACRWVPPDSVAERVLCIAPFVVLSCYCAQVGWLGNLVARSVGIR